MAYFILQILAIILGTIGMILTIIVTSMTQWRVSYMIEGNAMNCDKRIDGQWLSRWDGLWITCVTKNHNNMECTSYNSLVSITTDLKAARVLMSFAIVLSIIAFIIAFISLLCTRCCRGAEGSSHCLLITSGVGFLLAGILVLIPISWTTSSIIREISNPLCKTMQKIEIGEAVFLGWPTIFFLLVAGAIFCWYCPHEERCKSVIYSSQASIPQSVYVPCHMQEKREGEKSGSQVQYSKSQYI